MVAGDQDLERGRVAEEVLSHQSRADAVAAREQLHSLRIPAPALLRLAGDDQSCTAQKCQICWMLRVRGPGERVHTRRARIIAQHLADDRQVRALAAAAHSVNLKQFLQADVTGAADSCELLQQPLYTGIALAGFTQELSPCGCIA